MRNTSLIAKVMAAGIVISLSFIACKDDEKAASSSSASSKPKKKSNPKRKSPNYAGESGGTGVVSSNGTTDTKDALAAAKQEMQGAWIGYCTGDKKDSAKSNKRRVVVTDDHIEDTTTVYSDITCTAADFSLHTHYDFAIKTLFSKTSARVVLVYAKGELTPSTNEIASLMATDKLCGIADWKKDEKREITECSSFENAKKRGTEEQLTIDVYPAFMLQFDKSVLYRDAS